MTMQDKVSVTECVEGPAAGAHRGGSLTCAESASPPQWIGKTEAREMFGVALRTWDQWQKQGRVRGTRFGRNVMYRLDDLERLREEIRRQTEPYPDPDRPGCYRVTLTSRLHQMEAIIDAESLPLVRGKRWWWSPGRGGTHAGAVVLATPGSPKPPLRQIIMGVRGKEHRVGHLNGDPLDCRRENLVVRTHAEQAATRRKARTKCGRPCTSRFKGVQWQESGRKWSVTITGEVDGRRKTLQLGRFRSEVEAALAYDAAASELWGEHARLNFSSPAEIERARALDKPVQPIYEEFPPPGMVDRDDACAMFGIASNTWTAWERKGRIRCGQYYPLPDDKPGRCKLYPIDELERLREEISQLGKPYPDPDRPGCYRVPLKGYLKYREAIVDAESLPIVEGRNWNWSPRSDEVGGGQVILAAFPGPNPPLARLIADVRDWYDRVTHANGDPLDCRRENLVVKTLQEQTFGNSKMKSRKGEPLTSRYKGVCWDRRRGLWVAQIVKDGEHHHVGRFYEEIEAAWAYDEAARELFGEEYAWLNFPDGMPRDLGEMPTRVLEMPTFESRTSNYIGVSWEKYSGQWLAMITADGKQRRLGTFGDEADAARAYDEAAREAHGEYAMVNFPTEEERKRAAGWYDRDRACEFFGVTRSVWKRWVKERKVTGGRLVYSARGGKRRVYTREELERLRDEMFGEDKLYKTSDGSYHVPAGFLRREEACSKFGVSLQTWWRWEREGWIQCGKRMLGLKLYRVEDIERLVEEHGCLSPPYPDPDRPGCYRVPLGSRDMTRREAIIDAESLPLIEGAHCHMAGTSDGVEFVSVSINGEHIPLRRLIMGVTSRKWHVGHVNDDPLDCRRENLVVRTVRQRAWSARKRTAVNGRACSSRFKGVTWDKQTERWRAVIRPNGRSRSLGCFDSEIDAAKAYDKAARELFGEHAWLNFPDEGECGIAGATTTANAKRQSMRVAA